MTRRKLVAGNWKMNGTRASSAVLDALAKAHPDPGCDVLICPPATLIAAFAGGPIPIGAQDCHWEASGANTGDIAAAQIADAGATAVILGHSERRADHAETDAMVAAKTRAAWAAGLMAIVCVGETEAQRDAGETLAVVGRKLGGSIPDGASPENLVVAYEPVWAIGTGRTPSLDEITDVHAFIRTELAARFGETLAKCIRVLYGGSVKPGNAAEIFALADVDGALVGGASLRAEDFGPIIAAAA